MIRVGILRGGTGDTYDISLKSGAYILAHLPKEKYEAVDIFIDRDGLWHMNGVPVDYDKLKHRVDIVWNALHGFYGADGKVSKLLDDHGIKRTGPDPIVSAITMNRKLLGDRLASLGVKTPNGVYVDEWGDEENAVDSVVGHVSRKLSPPWRVGAVSRAYQEHSVIVKTRGELAVMLNTFAEHKIPVLIEEEVFGSHLSTFTFPGFRNTQKYVCVPIAKYAKKTVSSDVKKSFADMASSIHSDLHLGDYSKIECVVTPSGRVYITHIEPHPELHDEADIHEALNHVGATFDEFAQHVLVR